jgi:hypothetical protein
MSRHSTFGPERVMIDLSREEFEALLYCLGIALGHALKEHRLDVADSMFRLTNAVNEGNPGWTPYEVETNAS